MATKSDLQKQVEKMEAGQGVYDIGMQTFSEEQWKTFDGALEASLLLTYTVDDKKNITNVKVGTAENALEKAMEKYEINIIIDLKCGKEWEEVLTCDLSYNYVKINAEYTT